MLFNQYKLIDYPNYLLRSKFCGLNLIPLLRGKRKTNQEPIFYFIITQKHFSKEVWHLMNRGLIPTLILEYAIRV